MAVTAVGTRNHSTATLSTFRAFGTIALTGTYVTGGFALNPLSFSGPSASGTVPLPSTALLDFVVRSPLGYVYSLVNGTCKIYTAANTELAAGALPEASVPYIAEMRKI